MTHTEIPTPEGEWRIGQLAEATGITVRALHHYDHTGLLSPTRQSSSGHRLYGAEDVARLYRILALRQLGFAIAQIKTLQIFTVIEEMTTMNSPIKTTISMLVYNDLTAAYAYLRDVLGLTASTIDRAEDGSARFAELFAGDHAIWLHPTGEGYRSPSELGAVSNMTVIAVDDVDSIYSNATSQGAEIVQEPIDQDYGVREFGVRDLEGHLWYFHQSLG